MNTKNEATGWADAQEAKRTAAEREYDELLDLVHAYYRTRDDDWKEGDEIHRKICARAIDLAYRANGLENTRRKERP